MLACKLPATGTYPGNYFSTMDNDKRPSVALSYRTSTDSEPAQALAGELETLGIELEKLPYLTFKGFPMNVEEAQIKLKVDAWIDHFMNILERSLGLIVIRSEKYFLSKGIAIERKLAEQIAPLDEDFTIVLDFPFITSESEARAPKPNAPAGVMEQSSMDISRGWARECVRLVRPWIERRRKIGPKASPRRAAEDVNPKGLYDNHEIQFTNSDLSWFKISVLDLYDRVWHCKRCYATSDVWLRTDYRPPARCPICGYEGNPLPN